MASDSDSDSGFYSDKWLKQQLNWHNRNKPDSEKCKKSPKKLNQSKFDNVSILSDSIEISSSSEDDIELEEEIKVCYVQESSKVHRFPILPSSNFTSVFERVSTFKSVPVDLIEIVMMPQNRDVSIYDSLKSLKYVACNMFNVFIKEDNSLVSDSKGIGDIEIKCAAPDKKIFTYRMEENQPLDTLISYCARDLKRDRKNLRLVFDGEVIKPIDTCASLGIEDQDLVEIHMIS